MKQNKNIFASTLFILISLVGVAQTSGGPPPPAPPPPPGLSIDTGIYILIAIAILYGAIKTLKEKA
ncbi:hypothetical protein ACFS5M_02750 [Lacinutrix iliipiscaria]|uniref:Signal peptidase n=1 Tax=Lacinutrix iliipiscaria TaxID=1230532 RepID=A0ABW5WJW4_9FLAO